MACKNLMIWWYSYIPQAIPIKQDTALREWPKFCKLSASVHINFLSLSTAGSNVFNFEMNRILLLLCHLLLRTPLARSWWNGLQKAYDLMVFLHPTGDAKKARHHLVRMTKICKLSASICMNFLSLSTVGNYIFWFWDEQNLAASLSFTAENAFDS